MPDHGQLSSTRRARREHPRSHGDHGTVTSPTMTGPDAPTLVITLPPEVVGTQPAHRGTPPAQRAPEPSRPVRPRQQRRPSHWHRVPYALAVLDCVVLAVALWVADVSAKVAALQVVVTLALLAQGRLYRRRVVLSAVDDLPALATRSFAGAALVVTLEAAMSGGPGRAPLVATGIVVAVGFGVRSLAYAVVRTLRRSGRVAHPTLVVGGGTVAARLVQGLLEHPEYGLRPVGFLDDDPLLDPREWPVPHLGSTHDLPQVLDRQRIDDVVVAYGSTPEHEVVDVLRGCARRSCEIFLVPRLFELHAVPGQSETVWGLPLVRLRRGPFRSASWQAKRAFDILAAGSALAVLAPLMALVAAAVKWEIRGQVLFRQERVGLDGRPFTLLKFCSLRPADPGESAVNWNVGHDHRVGPIGKFLRRTSIDELPQLWNILRGDMSVVGPRPERPYFVERFGELYPRYHARHRVPVGLTGLAQVNGLRGDTSIGDRVTFDNHYIETWSFWQDIKIILQTCSQVVRAAGR